MRHQFRGKRYKIIPNARIKRASGYCDNPSTPGKRILLKSDDDDLEYLDTAIHEALHACYPDNTEDAIDEAASSIASFLIKLGYRRYNSKPT